MLSAPVNDACPFFAAMRWWILHKTGVYLFDIVRIVLGDSSSFDHGFEQLSFNRLGVLIPKKIGKRGTRYGSFNTMLSCASIGSLTKKESVCPPRDTLFFHTHTLACPDIPFHSSP